MQKFNTDGIYERLSWQQPERKDQAGKVTVFGGLLDMAWIRATCRGTEEVEGCGDVEIRSTEVIIRICENLGG